MANTNNGANLGFDAKLWAATDALCNNMNDRDQIIKAIAEAKAEIVRLKQARARTAAELAKLRATLASVDDATQNMTEAQFNKYASPEEKVHLFADLFRGRDDVFARLWENRKTGKKGYSPVCEYEWQPGICTKPEKKCTNCKYVSLSHEVLRAHLEGQHIIGVYPLRKDETCYFLAVDLDKANWQEDAAAFLEVCKLMNVPAALERSRSGNGGHVWIFFSEPVPAYLTRNMGSYLLTETMSRHHQLSMTSYDRLFPNQDTMPKGGFGNLIALPLQKQARKFGNTEFLDEQFLPHPDQWAYLASIRKMNLSEVQALANEAAKNHRITGVAFSSPEEDNKPWLPRRAHKNLLLTLRGQLPPQIRVTLADRLYVEKAGLPSSLLAEIKRLASFQNPKFYEAQRMRRSTFQIPRIISCAEEFPQHLAIPRGCWEMLHTLLEPFDVVIETTDERVDGESLEAAFYGNLTGAQENAVGKLLQHDMGIFVAPPGIGKTVVGIYLIAQRKRSTLILVHRQPLLEQWQTQLAEFLNLQSEEIGVVAGGKNTRTGKIDVAMLQSLVRENEVEQWVGEYGYVIVDECHHVPAFSFEQVLKNVCARYVTGLTATPYRRDGHHPIIAMQCGPVRCRIDSHDTSLRLFKRRLICRETGFVLPDHQDAPHHEILHALVLNENRNQLIVNDVIQVLQEKRFPLILTERREHLELLHGMLEKVTGNLIVLHGGKSAKDRNAIMQQLKEIPETEGRVILATGAYIGEGFDDRRLDTLFLAMPISFKGKMEQYAGRILRPHPGKEEVRIYDYVDSQVPMLARMFKKRLKAYRAMKYEGDEIAKLKKHPLAKADLSQLQLKMVA
ncbi:DEAD/DEAH box helicase [candidate division KSB1 bacterium]|nr:DEAD/DEAH box helicase [candidate division KSB1 bacterium]